MANKNPHNICCTLTLILDDTMINSMVTIKNFRTKERKKIFFLFPLRNHHHDRYSSRFAAVTLYFKLTKICNEFSVHTNDFPTAKSRNEWNDSFRFAILSTRTVWQTDERTNEWTEQILNRFYFTLRQIALSVCIYIYCVFVCALFELQSLTEFHTLSWMA